jgi:hypothetical protein
MDDVRRRQGAAARGFPLKGSAEKTLTWENGLFMAGR